MSQSSLATQFAPAERLTDQLIIEQAQKMSAASQIPALFNILPYIVLILNKQRQIVYSNNSLFEALGLRAANEVLGLRPGEVLKCIHADEGPGGCGTSECCSVCGSVQAILESQRTKSLVSKECHVTLQSAGGPASLDLLIYAAPVEGLEDEFTLFVVKDIGEEKRKKVFERVFFHDLLNTSGAVQGLIELLQTSDNLSEIKELCRVAYEGMDMLIEEIVSQRELIAAENGELALRVSRFSVNEMLSKLVNYYRNDAKTVCAIRFDPAPGDPSISSDLVLTRRVIGNMLKNAIEASGSDDSVAIGCSVKDGVVEFLVRNSQFMPKEVQMQIFQRSFSSKGSGRGIGTYSMKLLGEKLLGGRIAFSTDPQKGTEFRFQLPIPA